MDTAWIQVFVLTIAECVAPAGKTICQEQQFDLQFLTRADCEVALEQFLALKEESPSVIVNRNKSRCAPSARQSEVFASLDAVSGSVQGADNWLPPSVEDDVMSPTNEAYEARLAKLPSCEASNGAAPCKIGSIIVESAVQGESVEIWRRDR